MGMKAKLAAMVFLAAASWTAWAGSSAVAGAAGSSLIYSRQSTFSIPFRVAKAANPRDEAAEVHLYVSADRGAHWQLYGKVAPTAAHFIFRAAGDGEYWFAVRTVDRNGKVQASRATGPELRVVVDTVIPQLEVKLTRGQAGEVTAHWQVNEPTLKAGSLKIQYRASAQDFWQSVALDPSQTTGPPQPTGDVTWWPMTGTPGQVQVRAEVADAAGNIAIAHAQLAPEPVAEAPPVAAAAPASIPAGLQPGAAPGETVAAGPLFGAPTGSGALTKEVAASKAVVPVTANSLSGGQRPRMVNSCVFELAFDVASVGPSSVAKIVVWGTRDNGATWSRHGASDGPGGRMLVKVDSEGLWGFRLALQTGTADQPPKAGETPDVWIGVDLSAPSCRFVSARQGEGELADRVAIAWQATDNLLAERPITILVSEQAHGPWTAIGSNVSNNGNFNWTIDGRVPAAVFFRIEARDEAGNVGWCESSAPLALQPVRPAIHVHGVHAVESSASNALPLR